MTEHGGTNGTSSQLSVPALKVDHRRRCRVVFSGAVCSWQSGRSFVCTTFGSDIILSDKNDKIEDGGAE